jgi:predicted nucleotidyltransferase
MDDDLAFVQSDRHCLLLKAILDQAQHDGEVTGVLLFGSVARGDAYPGSDLDVFLLLRDGCYRAFLPEVKSGILVEIHHADFDRARSEIEHKPMRAYAFLDGRILYDPDARLGELIQLAGAQLEAYCVPDKERASILYWLRSVRIKVAAARDAGDLLRAAYVASTSSWKILEGLWAANERPIPANAAVWTHLKDLPAAPQDLEPTLQRFFAGAAPERVEAAIAIVDWVIPRLEKAPGAAPH